METNYAKFDIAEPPLNLMVNYRHEVEHPGALNHLGIEVPSTIEVLATKKRLQNAGLVTTDEMNVQCCLQDKLWIVDPDGNRWEIFTVKVQDTQAELTMHQKNNPRNRHVAGNKEGCGHAVRAVTFTLANPGR